MIVSAKTELLSALNQIAEDTVTDERNSIARRSQFARLLRCRFEVIVIAVYGCIVAFAIPFHEPWADEAQAWQLARTLSLHDLFIKYIRYEGSPGLWHFLLWLMIRAHVSYLGLHWICGGIALAGIACFVLTSPFPRYLRLLLPFTYFLLFQYVVVARSYVLVPLILFVIAWRWKANPVMVALMLGLLANLALHAAVISGGLAVVYLIDNFRIGSSKSSRPLRQLLLASLTLITLYAITLWTAWPPHDLSFARPRGVSRQLTLNFVASLFMGTCQPWIISIPFWGAIAFCFYVRRKLFYLLPVILFAIFSGAVQVQFWHGGLLVPLLIALLWITWPSSESKMGWSEIGAQAALVVMATAQILWSGYALNYDHFNAYSADLAAAKFLRPFVQRGDRVALTYIGVPSIGAYFSVGILPYFKGNIFLNQPMPFWLWSDKNPTEADFLPTLNTHPKFVLVEVAEIGAGEPLLPHDPKIQEIRSAGYRPVQFLCGRMPERFGLEENRCHWFFQRFDGPRDRIDTSLQPQGFGEESLIHIKAPVRLDRTISPETDVESDDAPSRSSR